MTRRFHLAEYVLECEGIEDSERKHNGPLCTWMEALLGTIYDDSGRDVAAVRGAMYQLGLGRPDAVMRWRHYSWNPQHCEVTVEVAASTKAVRCVPLELHPSRKGDPSVRETT